jgi:hypothetical protein
VAVTGRVLRLARRLRAQVGRIADDTVRDLAKSWSAAWSRLLPGWSVAASDMAATAQQLERWPGPWDVPRIGSVSSALQATAAELDMLALGVAGSIGDAAKKAMRVTADLEPEVIAAQLRAARQVKPLLDYALDAMVVRVRQQITAQTRPLSADADRVLRQELVRGVGLGQNPTKIAAEVVRRVDGAFAGGWVRASTVARTEVLDSHRQASRQIHEANSDVLAGWRWLATVEGTERSTARTCVACWAMHGTLHAASEPGPAGHPNCRCARCPLTKSWAELGIPGNEPEDIFPDARAIFAALPRDRQVAVMGPARLALLDADPSLWDWLAVERENPGWRTSFAPRSVASLQAIADSRRSAA